MLGALGPALEIRERDVVRHEAAVVLLDLGAAISQR